MKITSSYTRSLMSAVVLILFAFGSNANELLAPNSSHYIVEKEASSDFVYYRLDNGSEISENHLEYIRELSDNFGNPKDLADRLIEKKVIKRRNGDLFYITSKEASESGISIYVGVDDEGPFLRYKVTFSSHDWLHVKSYSLKIDDFSWQSPITRFEHEYVPGRVWEWIDLEVTEKELDILKRLAVSESASIEFHGRHISVPVDITEEQTEKIRGFLDIYVSLYKNMGAASKGR